MHILVTGGAGFIGSHIVEYHLAKGNKVHALDDLSTGSQENILPFMENPNFRFDQVDVLTWKGLDKTAAWADHIYHMAAVVGLFKVLSEPVKTLAVNIAGCERMLRAAHAGNWNPTITIASSSEVYGKRTVVPFQEDVELTVGSIHSLRWNYATSKLANETFGSSYSRKFEMNIRIVRLFNTIGPRQTGRYGMVVPRFVEQAVSNKPITVFGDGKQSRCFCDVRDTVAMLDMLSSNPASKGQVVNLGNDREISIRELAALVKERAGSSSQIIYIPYEEAYGEGFEDIQKRKPSMERLSELTQYKHKWKLEDTIDDLIARARTFQMQGS
jgi:UDP-glucose 4-epimerase